MRATDIIRAEYGTARNFMTPDRLHAVLVRNPDTGEIGAAEISEGTGFPTRAQRDSGARLVIYGVSVVWVAADGTRRRTLTDEVNGSQVFHDEPTHEPWPTRGTGYAEALAYVRSLGGKV